MYLQENLPYSNFWSWIGYNDIKTEKHWVWQDSDKNGTYQNWYRNEPDNAGEDENCGIIELPGGLWRDVQCTALMPSFICEKGKRSV